MGFYLVDRRGKTPLAHLTALLPALPLSASPSSLLAPGWALEWRRQERPQLSSEAREFPLRRRLLAAALAPRGGLGVVHGAVVEDHVEGFRLLLEPVGVRTE